MSWKLSLLDKVIAYIKSLVFSAEDPTKVAKVYEDYIMFLPEELRGEIFMGMLHEIYPLIKKHGVEYSKAVSNAVSNTRLEYVIRNIYTCPGDRLVYVHYRRPGMSTYDIKDIVLHINNNTVRDVVGGRVGKLLD